MNLSVIKKVLVENAPAIFTGLAIAGTIETVALTARAVPRIERKINKKKREQTNYILGKVELSKREIVDACWTECVPPALMLSATIFFILAANQAHIRKEAGLAAAYSLYEGKYKDYKLKNRELFGKENDEKIEQDIAEDRIKKNPPPGYLRAYANEDEKFLCYEPITDQYFMANKSQLLWAELTANKIMQQQSTVTLNQILKLFPGACVTNPIGNRLGWYLDDSYYEWMSYNSGFWGNPWMDIEPKLTQHDGQDIFIINFSIKPMSENMWDFDEVMDSQDLHAS